MTVHRDFTVVAPDATEAVNQAKVEVVARWVLRPYNPREAHRGDR